MQAVKLDDVTHTKSFRYEIKDRIPEVSISTKKLIISHQIEN